MSTFASPAQPSTIRWSFILWLLTVLLGVIGSVLLLVLSGAAIAAGSRGMTLGAFIVAAIVGIVIALIELLIVFKMRNGRNWARIVLLILAILQVIGNGTQAGVNNWSNWIGLVAVIVATVLMFVPASNAYFRGNRPTAAPQTPAA